MSIDPANLTGSTLGGRYEIMRDLGEESLGRTYMGRDLREDGRLVQIKAIAPDIGGDEETFARFGREISASFMVSHPNTLEVFDYGQQGEVRYLVSEYLAAHPMSEDLAEGTLPVPRVAAIAHQIVSAIGAAHQEGIVHRALSPDTVLLLDNVRGPGDFIKVRDFGLSKLDDESEAEVTRAGVRVGNPAYMAPEYVQTGVFDPKGDLYALGCLMFEAVAGRPPHEGDRSTVLHLQVEGEIPNLATLVPGAAGWFAELVERLLAKDPSARPGTHAVAQMLEEGVGSPLQLPELWPLDDQGAIERSDDDASEVAMPARIAGVAAVAVLGGVALLVVLIAAIATVVLVLTLPS